MPSFLIVHAATPDGRIDGFVQPPTLDVGGWRAPLDWGDVTLHVPAGDLAVTIFVTRTDGLVEGARITLRTPAGTGTRLTFVPPLHPGGQSQLRIDGQWPSDPSMYYYAARDARVLVAPPLVEARPPQRGSAPQLSTPHAMSTPQAMSAPQLPTPHAMSAPQQHSAQQQRSASPQAQTAPSPAPAQHAAQQPAVEHEVRVVSPAAVPVAEVPTTAVGPTPGSSAAVPPEPTPFGHEKGARVDPVQAVAPAVRQPPAPMPQAPMPQAPTHQTEPTHPTPSPSFGQRLQGEPGPPIPTPAEFSRLEEAARVAQLRAYEAWQAQQQAAQPAGPTPHDGAPQPIGLGQAQGGQAQGGQAQANWYPDPYRRSDARWYDGRQWTSSVMRGGVRGSDPLG